MKFQNLFKILKFNKRQNYTQTFRNVTNDGRVVYLTKYGSRGIGWTSLSLINAGLAENKGRNKFSWLILSFLLGPFATAYIVFTSPVNKGFQ
jgi:hypothetical protein